MTQKIDSGDSVLAARGGLWLSRPGSFWDEFPLVDTVAGSTSHYQRYIQEFILWEGPTVASAAPGTAGWTAAQPVAAGGGDMAIDVKDNDRNGVLRIITDAGDNDNAFLRQNGSPFAYTSGKRFWFYCSLAPQTANDGEIICGLIPEGANADPIGTEPTTGYYFHKAETATTFNFRAKDTSDSGGAVAGTLSDDTFIHLGFRFEGSGDVTVWTGATALGMVKRSTIVVGATGLSTDLLQIVLGLQTGSIATRYIDVDALYVVQQQ